VCSALDEVGKDWQEVQSVECQPSKHKALNSYPSIEKNIYG
jgi:hypothetical protein